MNQKKIEQAKDSFIKLVPSLHKEGTMIYDVESALAIYGIPHKPNILSNKINVSESLLPQSIGLKKVTELLLSETSGNMHNKKIEKIPIDLLSVLLRNRDVCRLTVSIFEIAHYICFCDSCGLLLTTAPFIYNVSCNSSAVYSNRIIDFNPSRIGKDTSTIIYISRDIDHLITAWIAEILGDDHALGLLLGYPECCVEHYLLKHKDAALLAGGDINIYDLLFSDTREKYSEFPIWTNNITRYFSQNNPVAHFPCSYKCKKTIESTKSLVSLLETNGYDTTEHFRKMLNTFVIVTLHDGIICFKDFEFDGVFLKFGKESYSSTNEKAFLYNALESSDCLKINNEFNAILFYNDKGKKQYQYNDNYYLCDFKID